VRHRANWLAFIGVVFFTFSILVTSVEADSVVRSGNAISIAEEQIIEGDFYTTAWKVNVSGSVEEDMITAGSNVTINGPIGGDGFIVGGQVDIHGTVGDDLRILGAEVIIAEPVMGDVFVVAGTVHILSTASIAGDIVIFGGEAVIEGSVGGDILGNIDTLRIDAQVAGMVDVTVGQLTLGDRTKVQGSVRYVSNNLAVQSLNANVGAGLVRSDPVLPMVESSASSTLMPIFILLFSTLIWFWLSRSTLHKVADRALDISPRPVILGVVTLIFAPIITGVLIASFIGSLVGLVVLLTYLLLLILSFVAMPAVIGRLLMRILNKTTDIISLTTMAIGVIGVALLLLLPVVGHVLLVGFMVLTLGTIVDILAEPKKV
jgi:cytoskeletal protein CcmA (bactofilin family)